MVPSVKTLLSISLMASLPMVALADPKPRNARPASAQKVINTYSGKTDLWERGCQGGIYLSPNKRARAWCSENSDSMAAGTWSVSQDGTLCQNLTWFWSEGANVGSSASEPLCIQHVINSWGVMYRRWPGGSEWWPMTNSNSSLRRGYVYQSDVAKARDKIGL
ncbi:DUF995 domain-containing protein [Tritonibacter scottomollicae]|uniref:DUF995 domain-containing protein n=1 Tax=Tritonibacter scottomollicae TaxID=483013 RepID=UPI003BA85A50